MRTQLHHFSEYQVGGSLPYGAGTYVSRQADQDLYTGLKAGQFCYVFSSRQAGKSSLRVRTMQRLQTEGVACATVDMSAIGALDVTPEQWYTGIIDSISNDLSLYDRFDLEQWWTEQRSHAYAKRLGIFLETILLKTLQQDIVLFIDEVDTVLNLGFNLDDFFTLLHCCYTQRQQNPHLHRLNIVLLGVTMPNILFPAASNPLFHKGRAISFQGFNLEQSLPLAAGLTTCCSHPQAVLQAILDWTSGQPFLTQKLCQLIVEGQAEIPAGGEAEAVSQVVRSRILENWELHDIPEHLKPIRDRVLYNKIPAHRLLRLYRGILQRGSVQVTGRAEEQALCLAGLVSKHNNQLQVYNRIYATIFNSAWIEQELGKLQLQHSALIA